MNAELTREEALRRVEKLLRLSVNPNAHEAHATALKALELTERYNLGLVEEAAPDLLGQFVGRCRYCGAGVVWATTERDRQILIHPRPLDAWACPSRMTVFTLELEARSRILRARYVPPAARRFGSQVYDSHFAHCGRL